MTRYSIKPWLNLKFISEIFCIREILRWVLSLYRQSPCRQNFLAWQIWKDLPKIYLVGFSGGPGSKESDCSSGGQSSIPELGRSLVEGNDCPLQYCCLQNPMDRGI